MQKLLKNILQKNTLIENTDPINIMVSSFLTLLYKNRFLLLYVIFGVISLLLEEIVRGILKIISTFY